MPLPQRRTKMPTRPLNLAEMRAFLRAGHTLTFRGSHIQTEDDLPDLDELAAIDPSAARAAADEARAKIADMKRQSEALQSALDRIGRGEDPHKVIAEQRARREEEATGFGRERTRSGLEPRPEGVPEFSPPPPPRPGLRRGEPGPRDEEPAGIDPARLRQAGVDVEPGSAEDVAGLDDDEGRDDDPAGAGERVNQGDSAAQTSGAGAQGAVSATPPRPTATGPGDKDKKDGTGLASPPPAEVQETGAGPKPTPLPNPPKGGKK